MNTALLLALLRVPFLSLANAALFVDAPHATVDRALKRLSAPRA